MWLRIRPWLPELLLAAVALFFFYRELGTFPAAWADDSLFMVVAKRLATGHGYSLPALSQSWEHPFILGVGPTLIWPVALCIKLFGFSVAVARIPMTIYLIAAALLTYAFTDRYVGRREARWSTALLITLSAFVNTGKPVLGEVPGFVFLIAGLLLFERVAESWKWAATVGLLFGLAVVSKITDGLIFPALALAWGWAAIRKEWDDVKDITIVGIAALITFLIFSPFMGMGPQFFLELRQYGLAGGGTRVLDVLQSQPELLTRFPYLFFGTLLALAIVGARSIRYDLSVTHRIILWSLIVLDILYFLNERGWYRHLLLAHLLIMPFVAAGAFRLLGSRMGKALLLFFVLSQSWWQLTYMGSRWIREAELAAEEIEKMHQDTSMVIEHPEVYVRLSENPRWMFLSDELKIRDFPVLENIPKTQDEHCLPILRKISEEDARQYGSRIQTVYRRYSLLMPEEGCTPKTL